jgi:hypothetical protein
MQLRLRALLVNNNDDGINDGCLIGLSASPYNQHCGVCTHSTIPWTRITLPHITLQPIGYSAWMLH